MDLPKPPEPTITYILPSSITFKYFKYPTKPLNRPKNSLLVLLKISIVKVKISFIFKKGTKGLNKIRKLESIIK